MYEIILFRASQDEREAWRQLRQAGFAEGEAYQLLYLRRRYAAEQAKWKEVTIYRRLQFVRWLVRTGRLTEQTFREQRS